MAIELRASNGIVEFFSATSTTTPSGVNISDAAVGDVRVIIVNASPDGTGTVPTDWTITGWTQLFPSSTTGAASDSRLSGFYREVQSGDTLTGASLSWTYSNTATTGSVAFTLEGVDLANILDQTSPTPTGGTHPIVSPTITTQTDDAWVISAGAQDATTGAIDDTDVPTGMTVIGTMNNNPPSNGMNLGVAYVEQASLGASGTKTWQTNTGSEEVTGASCAFRPAPIGISSVTPSEFDMDNGDIDVASSALFGATIGSSDVYLSPNDLLSEAGEVDITAAVNTWGASLINLDLTLLSQATLDLLHTMGPGDRFLIVNVGGVPATTEYFFPVTVHRPQAIQMVLGAIVPGTTTARLTGMSGTFGGGRAEETAAQNPSTTTTNVADNGNREDVWSMEAKPLARAVTYDFRVRYGADLADTVTTTPQLVVSEGETIVCTLQTYTLTGIATNLEKGYVLPATLQTYTLAGIATNLEHGRLLTADLQTYVLTGIATNLLHGQTLIADLQTYTLTGIATPLVRTHQMVATLQTYALTGIDTPVTKGFSITCDVQSYALTGIDTGLLRTHVMPADLQTYTLTGIAAILSRQVNITADLQTYTLTGVAAILSRQVNIVATLQTYTLTGIATNLLHGQVLTADLQTYALTGIAVNLIRGKRLTADLQTYTLTGIDVTLIKGGGNQVITCDTQTYILTGIATNTEWHRILTATLQTYALTGIAADLSRQVNLTADVQAYVLTGIATPTLWDHVLPATLQTYVLTGIDTTLNKGFRLAADLQTYTLTGINVNLSRGYVLTADLQTYVLTGIDVNLIAGEVLIADLQTYVLTGVAINLLRGYVLTADTQSYALTGLPVTLTVSSPDNPILIADTQTYLLTGIDAGLTKNIPLVADLQTYTVTGIAINFLLGHALVADTQAYDLTGIDTNTEWGRRLVAGLQTYSLTGIDIVTTKNIPLVADLQTYALTGLATTLSRTYILVAGLGIYVINAPDTDVFKSGVNGWRIRDEKVSGWAEISEKSNLWSSNGWMVLAGIPGNYASSPDAAPVDIIGDIDLIADIASNSYVPGENKGLISKWDLAPNLSYVLFIFDDGGLGIAWSDDGTAVLFAKSTVLLPTLLSAGDRKKVRATLDVDNGASGRDIKFYLSDDGIVWTQLGATVTQAGVTSIFSSNTAIEIGSVFVGTELVLDGNIYRAQVFDGIDGTLVFDADFGKPRIDDLSFLESSSNAALVTINQVGGNPAHIRSEQPENPANTWTEVT